MQRTWRGKSKPRKKNRYRGQKSPKWNPESEDAFYEKAERKKRHQLHQQMNELEQFDELEMNDEFEDSDDLKDSNEAEELEEAHSNT